MQTRESKESSCNAGLEAATDSETPEQFPQDHLHLTPEFSFRPIQVWFRSAWKETARESAHYSDF